MSNKIPTKLIVGILGIIVLLGGLYVFVFSGDSTGTESTLQVASTTSSGQTTDGSAPDTAVDTDQVLRQLNELRRININTDFFNSDAFLSLRDFGVTINPQEVGRDNPFLPSTYVPDGASIVPRANPAVPQPIGSEGPESASSDSDVATTSSESATSSDTAATSATTGSAGN